MDNFKKMIGEMKQAEQKEEAAAKPKEPEPDPNEMMKSGITRGQENKVDAMIKKDGKLGNNRFLKKGNDGNYYSYGGGKADQKMEAGKLLRQAENQESAKAKAQQAIKDRKEAAKPKPYETEDETFVRIMKQNELSPEAKQEIREKAQKAASQPQKPQQPKKPLFDEYGLATEEGSKASADFLKRNGIEDVFSLTNEQYNALAKKAMDEFGIKDLSLAKEFIQSNEKSDRRYDERVARQSQPKQGTFREMVDSMSEEDVTDEDIKRQLESGRFATFEEENKTIDEAAASLGKSIGISPERAKRALLNIYGKDYWQELPKDEPKAKSKPQPQQQNGFQYTEELGNYNDYYGAKTGSERNLNLYTSNDRDLYNYVSTYFPELIEKAETDPQGAVESMVRHASPIVRGDIDPKNVSPEYVRKLLAGFAEGMSEEQEPFTEKEEDYNDYYGAKTHSEREFNVETGNDERMYNYILANKGRLLRNAKYYPSNVVNDIIRHGQYPSSFYGIDPKNIRKDYLIKVISGLGEE